MKAKKDQFQRFKDASAEFGADDTGAEFERAFKKIVPPRIRAPKESAKPKKRGKS